MMGITNDSFKVVSLEGLTPLTRTLRACTCSFAIIMGLPWKNIFKAKALLCLPLFDSRRVIEDEQSTTTNASGHCV